MKRSTILWTMVWLMTVTAGSLVEHTAFPRPRMGYLILVLVDVVGAGLVSIGAGAATIAIVRLTRFSDTERPTMMGPQFLEALIACSKATALVFPSIAISGAFIAIHHVLPVHVVPERLFVAKVAGAAMAGPWFVRGNDLAQIRAARMWLTGVWTIPLILALS